MSKGSQDWRRLDKGRNTGFKTLEELSKHKLRSPSSPPQNSRKLTELHPTRGGFSDQLKEKELKIVQLELAQQMAQAYQPSVRSVFRISNQIFGFQFLIMSRYIHGLSEKSLQQAKINNLEETDYLGIIKCKGKLSLIFSEKSMKIKYQDTTKKRTRKNTLEN